MSYNTVIGVCSLAGEIYNTLLAAGVDREAVQRIGSGRGDFDGSRAFHASLRKFAIREAKSLWEEAGKFCGAAKEDAVENLESVGESALSIIDSEFGSMPGGGHA